MQISKKTQDYIDTIKEQMDKIGCLEESDKKNLDLLATQLEMYYRALEDIEKNGITCLDQRNRMAVNPAFTVSRSCMATIVSLMKELSLSARQRRLLTNAAMVEEEDPMDLFLGQVNSGL